MTVIPRADIPGTYVVHSGPNYYNVDLRNPFEVSCDCASGCWTDRICAHIKLCLAYRDGEAE